MSRWVGLVVSSIAIAVLLGWATASPRLVMVVDGWPAMMPMTALGLLALASTLLLESRTRGEARRSLSRLPVLVTLAIGVWSLLAYALELPLGPERWLFPRSLSLLVPDPLAGRPSPQTAVTFVLAGLALLGIDSPNQRRSQLARGLLALAGFETLIVLSGRLYGEEWLYGISRLIGMAAHTAVALGLLSIGIAALAPDRGLMRRVLSDTTGGLFLRVTLPLALLIPFVAGLLVRQAELYDLWSVSFSQGLYQTTLIALLLGLLVSTERIISQSEARRVSLTAEQTARASEQARREELERTLLVRQRFINLASHELNTPLTTLMLACERHKRSLARLSLDDPRPRESLATINHQLGQLRRLVANILAVQRVWSEAPAPTRARVDLAKLVREVTESLREEWPYEVGIELDLPESVVGSWDEAQLAQLIENLVTNALVHGQSTPVSITLATHAELAVLTVADRGPGVDPAILPEIFESFDRADPNTPYGLGLGLFIVKSIVDRHRGEIRVIDRDPGAAFEVTLSRESG